MKNLDNDNRENTNEMCRHIGKLRRNWEENQKKIQAMLPHMFYSLCNLRTQGYKDDMRVI